jgi:hypothetical protein
MLGVAAVIVLPFSTTTLVAAVAPTVTASRHGGNAGLIRSKRHFAGMHRLPAKFTRSHSCNPPYFAPAKDYFAMR